MRNIDEKRLFYVITAYCIGIIVGTLIVGLVTIICRVPFLWGVKAFGLLLPIFIGSFFAGFIARHKGWLVASILTLIIEIVIYTPAIVSSDYEPIIPFRVEWIIAVLFTSLIAGYLGQFLAQIWRKRGK
jgi:hypothetical protein